MKDQNKNKSDDADDSMMEYTQSVENVKMRQSLHNFLVKSKILFSSRILNLLVSVILITQCIAFTYTPESFTNVAWGLTNTILRCTIVIQIMFEIIAAAELSDYLLSVSFFTEILLTMPYFIMFAVVGHLPDLDVDLIIHVTFINLISVIKLRKLCDTIENEVNKQLLQISVTIISLVLILSGLINYIYKVSGKLNEGVANKQLTDSFVFYDYFFFIMTIASTVGYENPFFGNPVLRFALMFIIFISIVIIPAKSSELISILSNKSIYSRISYKRVDSTEFIVLCGSLGTSSVVNFLSEFFHEDHGSSQRHCIILSPNRPDNDMENLLRDTKYEKIIKYIQGDPNSDIDLRRAQADKAKAVVIMCNKHSINPEEEDSKTVLHSISIRKFLGANPASITRICVQLLRSEGKSHYALPGSKQDSNSKQEKNDQIICLEELKLSLFAKSCLCPGLIAMITNLVNSAGDLQADSSTPKWLEEYWHGIGFEIYKTQLSKVFADKTFSEAAAIIYKKFNAILFGIEAESARGSKICINPGNKRLKEDNVGYIIAQDKEVADSIRDYDMEERVNRDTEGHVNLKSEVLRSIGRFIEGDFNLTNAKMAGTSDFNVHVLKNCYVSKTKIDIVDVTYDTMNGNILATNHIILAGMVSNLNHFVMPLRSKLLNKIPPIIILNEDRPDHKTWSPISHFPEIYFVKVNPSVTVGIGSK